MDSRLEKILAFVPNNSKVADVGTDHGYLAIELIKRKIAIKVIASDKNKGPLESAQKNVKAVGFEEKIELRLGDGLKSYKPNEVDVICIAGMGGVLVCEILNESPEVIAQTKKLILQPMNAIDKIREWSKKNGFYIEDEDLAEVDDRIYEILCLSRNKIKKKSTSKLKSPLYKKLIETEINKLKKIINSMNVNQKLVTSEKYISIQKQIEELEMKLNESTNDM